MSPMVYQQAHVFAESPRIPALQLIFFASWPHCHISIHMAISQVPFITTAKHLNFLFQQHLLLLSLFPFLNYRCSMFADVAAPAIPPDIFFRCPFAPLFFFIFFLATCDFFFFPMTFASVHPPSSAYSALHATPGTPRNTYRELAGARS
jgi:hypothetical protein